MKLLDLFDEASGLKGIGRDRLRGGVAPEHDALLIFLKDHGIIRKRHERHAQTFDVRPTE